VQSVEVISLEATRLSRLQESHESTCSTDLFTAEGKPLPTCPSGFTGSSVAQYCTTANLPSGVTVYSAEIFCTCASGCSCSQDDNEDMAFTSQYTAFTKDIKDADLSEEEMGKVVDAHGTLYGEYQARRQAKSEEVVCTPAATARTKLGSSSGERSRGKKKKNTWETPSGHDESLDATAKNSIIEYIDLKSRSSTQKYITSLKNRLGSRERSHVLEWSSHGGEVKGHSLQGLKCDFEGKTVPTSPETFQKFLFSISSCQLSDDPRVKDNKAEVLQMQLFHGEKACRASTCAVIKTTARKNKSSSKVLVKGLGSIAPAGQKRKPKPKSEPEPKPKTSDLGSTSPTTDAAQSATNQAQAAASTVVSEQSHTRRRRNHKECPDLQYKNDGKCCPDGSFNCPIFMNACQKFLYNNDIGLAFQCKRAERAVGDIVRSAVSKVRMDQARGRIVREMKQGQELGETVTQGRRGGQIGCGAYYSVVSSNRAGNSEEDELDDEAALSLGEAENEEELDLISKGTYEMTTD